MRQEANQSFQFTVLQATVYNLNRLY